MSLDPREYSNLFPKLREIRLLLERLGMNEMALTIEVTAARSVELENSIPQPVGASLEKTKTPL